MRRKYGARTKTKKSRTPRKSLKLKFYSEEFQDMDKIESMLKTLKNSELYLRKQFDKYRKKKDFDSKSDKDQKKLIRKFWSYRKSKFPYNDL